MFTFAKEKTLQIKTDSKSKFILHLFPVITICSILIIYAVLFFSKVNNPHWIFTGDTLSTFSSYSYHFSGIARGEYPLWNPLARAGESDDVFHMLELASPVLNLITTISILSGVQDIVFSYAVYLFICISIYVIGVYYLVSCWTQNRYAGVFSSILAIGSSSVFFSEYHIHFIQLVHAIPWLLYALTMYFRSYKFQYLIVVALSCCAGFYAYNFVMGASYLFFLFVSILVFYSKQLLEKLYKLKTVPVWHFAVLASLLVIFILPEIFMGIKFQKEQITLQKIKALTVTDDYKLIYNIGFTRASLELISPRMWVTLFTGSYVPEASMLVNCVGPVTFPFLIFALLSFGRFAWCIAVSGFLIGLLGNNIFPVNMLYHLPGLQYIRNGYFYAHFWMFAIIIIAGYGFNSYFMRNNALFKKVFNISAIFLFFISMCILLFSKYFYYEFNSYNIAALLTASISMLFLIFSVNTFQEKFSKVCVVGITFVAVLFSYISINKIPCMPGGYYHNFDVSRIRHRTDHKLNFLYERPDEDKIENPLLPIFMNLYGTEQLDSKFASLLNLTDNSYKSLNVGGASSCYGSSKRYQLFIRLPGYEQMMRKKFFFFDKCFVSEEPKDMMAFKRDPELFTSVLARNIGIVDSIENDFGKVSAGKFKPESVSNIPVADVGDSFAADVKEYNANNIKITVKTNNEGLFTYTDLWDDGWHVRLDGKNAPLKKVFHTFKGVFLTAGVHEVEFFYRSRTLVSILVMNVAFAMCFLGLIAYLLLNLRKKFHTVC